MRCVLVLWCAAVVAAQTPAPALPAPCDPELAAAAAREPVFVRMRDQVFADAAAFPAWCAAHATAPRSALRREMLADLQQRADASWEIVGEVVRELETAGSLRQVQRYWIVNGFAAMADGKAVARLCRSPAVAFVHRQTQPGEPQQQVRPRSAVWLREREQDEARALELLAARGEEGAFDPAGFTVPWNLERIGAPAAWAGGATGEGIAVALLDSGVLCMEPLVHALWRNPGELPNGKDDDGNGLVDDLFGWDFDGDTRFCVGDGAQSHGTMCGGIIAGRPWGEPRTVTGVAPRARLMVLRGMGRLCAYEYAARMGADVLSMSYMWVDAELGSYRAVFRTAHEHLCACGVVAVGGAGNFGSNHPEGRQIALPKDIPCVIAAAGIGRDGTAPPFSSRGPCTWSDVPFFLDYPPTAPLGKPDVTGCCMEFPLWHRATVERGSARALWQDERGYGLILGPRGNSFAGPHAAGVAALMLSANRELPAFRVKELMESTCKDLGAKGRDCVYGSGLLQADAAVAAARAIAIATETPVRR